jgi:hypothetical protein
MDNVSIAIISSKLCLSAGMHNPIKLQGLRVFAISVQISVKFCRIISKFCTSSSHIYAKNLNFERQNIKVVFLLNKASRFEGV